LPGRSPLRTVRADLPHTALRLVVHPKRGLTNQLKGCGREHPKRGGATNAAITPITEVASVRFQRNTRFGRPNTAAVSGSLDQRSLDTGVSSVCLAIAHPPSCLAFAPRPLRHFSATMKALTPVRLSSRAQVSLLNVPNLPTILPPNTRWTPVVALTPYPSAQQISHPGTQATQCLPRRGSRLHHWLAGSSISPGRNGFVILRTGRSPPVALHPASRRRSYIRLQAGEGIPGEDFHLSD